MKWPYTPVSLPKRKFMERALELWKEIGLPPLQIKEPWWGRELGFWPREWDEHARMAAEGDYKLVGDELARQRRKLSPKETL
jgi:4-hydroxy-3-polyprenylbenzoate decarboxylase